MFFWGNFFYVKIWIFWYNNRNGEMELGVMVFVIGSGLDFFFLIVNNLVIDGQVNVSVFLIVV